MWRNARGTGVGRWRTRDRPWRRPRLWGVVAVVVALQVAGCGGGGTITDPSPLSRGAASTAEGPVSASAVVEGLGAPLPVRPVGHVSLADLVVHAVGITPAGDLWVAGAARWNRATLGLYGEWFVDPLATGVWHGTYGKPGTWYPMGSVEGLTVGPDGRVWVITGTALATFDQGTWRRVLGPGGAVLSGVSGQIGGAPSLAVGPDGWVWAVGPTFDTMVRFDGGVTVLSGPGWAADGAVCGIGTVAATAHGTAWTADANPWGYRGCLLRWDGATWTRERPLGLTELSIYRLASDTDGGLWAWLLTCEADENAWAAGRIPDACRRAQLAHFDGSDWTLRSDGPWSGQESADISMAAVNGYLWFAVNGRLFLFDGDEFLPVSVPPSVDLPVTAVLAAVPDGSVDSAGTAWVTTSDGALHRLPAVPAAH